MTLDSARKKLLLFALGNTGAHLFFFIVAPALGYKLTFPEALRMVEVVSPVFLGYIGAATQYVFQRGTVPSAEVRNRDLLGILVWGPIIIFTLTSIAALTAFGVANRDNGPGMLPETLSLILASNIGLLTISTNVIVSNVFNQSPK
jgi:hypothetical protein